MHCHTSFSDGSASVKTVMTLAARSGLSAISVTDHDTYLGSDEAKRFVCELNVKVVDGIEISSFDYERNAKVHVLCYFAKNREPINELCLKTLNSRRKVGEIAAQRLSEIFPITKEEFLSYSASSTSVYKQHFMRALMDSGYSLSVFSELYYELFRKGGKKYIGNEPEELPSVYDVLKCIKDANGVAVIAHPGFYNNFELVAELGNKKLLDGVEVWHPANNPEETKWLLDFAHERSLLKTGGTDFHGANNSLALPVGTYTSPDEELEKLTEFAEKG